MHFWSLHVVCMGACRDSMLICLLSFCCCRAQMRRSVHGMLHAIWRSLRGCFLYDRWESTLEWARMLTFLCIAEIDQSVIGRLRQSMQTLVESSRECKSEMIRGTRWWVWSLATGIESRIELVEARKNELNSQPETEHCHQQRLIS